jgi:hypothetical protein
MSSLSQNIAVRRPVAVTGRNGLLDRYFYFAMSLLMAAVVAWGFSHTVGDKLFHPPVAPPTIIWFHGAAFTAWIGFFIFQSALVRTHNVKLHRSLGWFGAALGTVMVPLGVTTTIIMSRFDTHTLHAPGVDSFMIVGFYDMIAFGACFALAIAWRTKPELHRRLLFIGTCCLLDAAFGRIDYIYNNTLFFYCVDAVILLGVLRDLLVNRQIHKVYLTALPLLIVAQTFVNYTWRGSSGWWLSIAHSLIG